MHKINRRGVLASLGMIGGSAVVSGCGAPADGVLVAAGQATPSQPAPSQPAPEAAAPWSYLRLDPDAVARTAYRIFPEGLCMYAVVGSVMTELSNKVRQPYGSFPLEMMRYGAEGMGGWGTLCGVVNGAAALVGLFRSGRHDQQREELLNELCLWYENTALPLYEPEVSEAGDIGASVAGSVLCHISVERWCRANHSDAFSARRRERCRRLSADGARMVVEMLNRDAGKPWDGLDIPAGTQSCIECHGRNTQRDTLTRMGCAICHQVDADHP